MRRLLPLAVLLSCLAAISVAAPAGAHSDDGTMEVLAAEQQSGGATVLISIGLLYANDDDLAAEARVSVTGAGPDGATLIETTVPHASGGRYEGTVDVPVPGSWTFTIRSVEPAAEAEAVVEVTAPATTAPETTVAPTTAPATTVPATTAPATTAPTTTVAAPVDNGDESDSDSGTSAIVIAVIVVAVLAAAGAMGLRALRSAPRS